MEQFITLQRWSLGIFLTTRSFSLCHIRFSPPIVSVLLNYYFVICLLFLEMAVCRYSRLTIRSFENNFIMRPNIAVMFMSKISVTLKFLNITINHFMCLFILLNNEQCCKSFQNVLIHVIVLLFLVL